MTNHDLNTMETRNPARAELRNRIRRDVENYVNAGGRIYQASIGESAFDYGFLPKRLKEVLSGDYL